MIKEKIKNGIGAGYNIVHIFTFVKMSWMLGFSSPCIEINYTSQEQNFTEISLEYID